MNSSTSKLARDTSKLARAFRSNPNDKAFIPFVTCGDPDIETTYELVLGMAEAGADVIELGIPFSDPTAEGPTIQAANLRALAAGTTTDKVLEMVRRIHTQTDVPLVFMTYANVVFSRGTRDFLEQAAEAGICGLILPDVPFEEKEEFAIPCSEAGIELISMIAPTSNDRVERIAREAEGFIYCVSSLGVTGTRQQITTDVGAMVELARRTNPEVPCAIGFGISTPQQAGEMAGISDGVIVGSAIVEQVAKHGRDCVEPVCSLVREMKQAVAAS